MEAYFATIFEDVRHERSLILVLSLTDRDILGQSKFTDRLGNNLYKKFSFRKVTHTTNIKRGVAIALLEAEVE